MTRLPNRIILFLLYLYRQFLSPVLPRVCRFTPSCSQYSQQAFEKYSFFRAVWLALRRISRCHPFCRGGFDPLP